MCKIPNEPTTYLVRDAEHQNGWHEYPAIEPAHAAQQFAEANEVNHGGRVEVKGFGQYTITINVQYVADKVVKGARV